MEPALAIAYQSQTCGMRGLVRRQQVLADDHDDESGRPDVLLRARVQRAELGHVDRLAQDDRADVGDERRRSPVSGTLSNTTPLTVSFSVMCT